MPFAGLLVFEKQLRRLDREVFELASVESRVGDAQTRLKAMAQQREALNQQTKRIADQLVAVRSALPCLSSYDRSRRRVCVCSPLQLFQPNL